MALTSAGMAVGGTSHLLNAKSYSQVVGAGRKVNIAYIGIGNRGEQIISEFAKTNRVNVVALCDVDMGAKHTQKVMGMYPNAKRYQNFRKMFDEIGNQFEAVAIATPDHSHFAITMLALSQGKHVYVEKPMARTFHEAELMMQAARRHPEAVTQVGNQGHSEANYFQFKAWMDAGIIKDVTAVTAHMNNSRRWHKWDANIYKYPDKQALPDTLDWMTWLMQCAYHDYNINYHLGDWRCWYDFGMGALGDWGAHLLDTVHQFLELGLPYEISMIRADGHNDFFFPFSSTILFRFAQRRNMPPVDVTWYDGLDNLPPLPPGYGVAGLDPERYETQPRQDHLQQGVGLQGSLSRLYPLDHPRGESERDGEIPARGTQEPIQPLRELHPGLLWRGEDPLAVRDLRTDEPDVQPWRHRPAPEYSTLLRSAFKTVHQQRVRQRHAGRHATSQGMGRVL